MQRSQKISCLETSKGDMSHTWPGTGELCSGWFIQSRASSVVPMTQAVISAWCLCLYNAHKPLEDNTHPDTDRKGVQRNVAAAAADYRAALSLRLRHSRTHPPSSSSKYFAFCDFIIYSKCIFVSPGSERDLKLLPHTPVLCDWTNNVPCGVCVSACLFDLGGPGREAQCFQPLAYAQCVHLPPSCSTFT